jgi:hypothetical protein
MVIGETFAWAHLPKTAGNATLRMWHLFPKLIVHADGGDSHSTHDPFIQRLDARRPYRLILNIRRLPAWNLSHAVHEARGGLYPDYQPRPMATRAEIAERSYGDDMLELFTDGWRLEIDHWLRQEFLEMDFYAMLQQVTDISEQQRQAIRNVGWVNGQQYDHRYDRWFTPAQIIRMYEQNPRWAAIERRAYGYTLDKVASA